MPCSVSPRRWCVSFVECWVAWRRRRLSAWDRPRRASGRNAWSGGLSTHLRGGHRDDLRQRVSRPTPNPRTTSARLARTTGNRSRPLRPSRTDAMSCTTARLHRWGQQVQRGMAGLGDAGHPGDRPAALGDDLVVASVAPRAPAHPQDVRRSPILHVPARRQCEALQVRPGGLAVADPPLGLVDRPNRHRLPQHSGLHHQRRRCRHPDAARIDESLIGTAGPSPSARASDSRTRHLVPATRRASAGSSLAKIRIGSSA